MQFPSARMTNPIPSATPLRTVRRSCVSTLAVVTALSTVGAVGAVGITAVPAAATADPGAVNGANTGSVVTVDVLGITDFHGRLAQNRLEGGAAVLAGAADQFRAQNPDTVLVANGDSIGGTTFVSAVQQDNPTLDVLNAMGVAVSSVGNHELDKGVADFGGRVVERSQFPYVAANVDGLPGVQPYSVWTSPQGVRVAFVGTITPKLPTLVSASAIEGVTVTDPAAAALRYADQLSDGDETNDEAEIVVVLAHDGPGTTDVSGVQEGEYGAFVQALKADGDVDAVMGGHTHIPYIHDLGDGFFATQAGQHSETVTKLSFQYDTASGELLPQATSAQNIALAPERVPAFPADPAVQAIVDAAVAQASVIGQEPIGAVTGDLLRGAGEQQLGNLIADAHLEATRDLGAQVAFTNPGGVRTDVLYAGDTETNPRNTDGVVTYEEAQAVQPFVNTLVTLSLTGAQLDAVLEEQWQAEGRFTKLAQSSSLTYAYDESRPQGDRVSSLFLDGEPVTPDQRITVVSNNFLAGGGDGFTTFAEATDHADSGRINLDVFVALLRDHSPVDAPADKRSVGVQVSGGGVEEGTEGGTEDAVVAGQPVTLTLSSLAFAASPEQGPDTVSVLFEGEELASAPVDRSEQGAGTGTATLEMTMPQLEPGEHTVTVQAGATSIPVVLTVVAADDVEPTDPDEPGGTPSAIWYMTDALVGDARAIGHSFFGSPTTADQVFYGDWDGDGTETPGFRWGELILLSNDPDGGDDRLLFLPEGAEDVFIGDFDGDGVDTFAYREGNRFFLDNDLDTQVTADVTFWFGLPSDDAFFGDFDGDGIDTPMIRRGNAFHWRNTNSTGGGESLFWYGRAEDEVHLGDWDGDGIDTPLVRRGSALHLKDDLATWGNASRVTWFRMVEGDRLVSGRLAPQAPDTLGIVTLDEVPAR